MVFHKGFTWSEVKPGTAAARSGLQRDDILVEFDGKKVSDLSAFERRIMAYPIGPRCALKVRRAEEEITLEVVIDEMPLELVGRAVETGVCYVANAGVSRAKVRDWTRMKDMRI